MASDYRFHFMDGRLIQAPTALSFFDRLRRSEIVPPPDVGRYLDLLRSRALIGLGVNLDVGTTGVNLEQRCRRALQSLARRGWVVVTATK